jgi:hypothetical protein
VGGRFGTTNNQTIFTQSLHANARRRRRPPRGPKRTRVEERLLDAVAVVDVDVDVQHALVVPAPGLRSGFGLFKPKGIG